MGQQVHVLLFSYQLNGKFHSNSVICLLKFKQLDGTTDINFTFDNKTSKTFWFQLNISLLFGLGKGTEKNHGESPTSYPGPYLHSRGW